MTVRSLVAWIDFSAEERRRMIEVVSLFRERNTLDELGLGLVRDALADRFFPGTSTLQTRARYFVFVPWLYSDYEQRQLDAAAIERSLRRDEVNLIGALQRSEDTDGIIGSRSGASLQRFPSSIYWNGLGAWDIRRLAGSQEAVHRVHASRYRQRRYQARTDDNEPVGGLAFATWDPDLPCRPNEFPTEASFALTYKEAAYLRDKLLVSCRDSLLATIIDNGERGVQADFVWGHPHLGRFPDFQRAWIDHARNFSEGLHGATLLYNLMLAELRQDPGLVDDYRAELAEWRNRVEARVGDWRRWDRPAFWRLVEAYRSIPIPTRRFIDSWLDLLLQEGESGFPADHSVARRLVRHREVALKRGRSRFESPRHLETWSGSSGAYQLNLRWPVAQRITDDILLGLQGDNRVGA